MIDALLGLAPLPRSIRLEKASTSLYCKLLQKENVGNRSGL